MKSSRSSSGYDSDHDIIDKKRVLEETKRSKKLRKERKLKKKSEPKKKDSPKRKDSQKVAKKKKDKKKKPKYGKYGTIGLTDLHQRREEFMMWLSEVKCFNIETLTQQDERRFFEEFVECYNTATLPSKKYYNFKVWYEKEQVRGRLKNQDVEMSVFNDELEKKKEQQEFKQMLRNQRITQQYQTLHECQDLAHEAQERQQLEELMHHQYRLGNHEEANKISRQLKPRRPVIVSGDTSSSEY